MNEGLRTEDFATPLNGVTCLAKIVVARYAEHRMAPYCLRIAGCKQLTAPKDLHIVYTMQAEIRSKLIESSFGLAYGPFLRGYCQHPC